MNKKREEEMASFNNKRSASKNDTAANVIVGTACHIINRLTDSIEGYSYSHSDIDIKSVFDKPTHDEGARTKSCSTVEEFISAAKLTSEEEVKNAIDKFRDLASTALREIRKHSISNDQKNEIRKIMDTTVDKLIKELCDMDIDALYFCGYYMWDIPSRDYINCESYIKQTLQEMIEDLARTFVDEICEGSSLTIKPNENQVQQQMATPMVQMGTVFNPVPNFSDDPDISRHFVIGNNVVIYDPNQQAMFKSLLKSLAQQLDQKDKEAGLTEPSKFGFSQFYNTGQFVAVRLNSENCFIPMEDTHNFMCIVMDNGNVSLTMPSKAA